MTVVTTWLRRQGKIPVGIALAVVAVLLLVRGNHVLIDWIGLVAAMALAWELSGLLDRSTLQRWGTAVAVGLACLVSKALLSVSRDAVNEFLLLAVLLWIGIAPLWLALGGRPPKALVAALGGFVIVSAWLSLSVLAEYDRWMLIVGVAAVCCADTFAWLAGKNFGKIKLAPKLSPGKTWEGALGALFALYLLATVLWWVYLDESYPHWLLLLIAATICALAILGDLVESALKRQAGVKDSGTLMGSHGGLFDRVDSWLPVLPFLALLSTLVT